MEKQPVGPCSNCGRIVHCDGGFLEGIVQPDHSILCFDCETTDGVSEQQKGSYE